MSTAVNPNIKNFRTFKGITQDDLAKRIGKSKNVISNWERGDNSPDVESVAKICVELDVTPNQLFGWERFRAYDEYVRRLEETRKKIHELEIRRDAIQDEINQMTSALKAVEARGDD